MKIDISPTKVELGRRAAEHGAQAIRATVSDRGAATIVLATCASQFEMQTSLFAAEGIDWTKVEAFHLDEYAEMPMDDPASFRRYLKERFVDRPQQPIGATHYINAEGDLKAECDRLARIIGDRTFDVALIGIGENGHLAFDDPPADFETPTC